MSYNDVLIQRTLSSHEFDKENLWHLSSHSFIISVDYCSWSQSKYILNKTNFTILKVIIIIAILWFIILWIRHGEYKIYNITMCY